MAEIKFCRGGFAICLMAWLCLCSMQTARAADSPLLQQAIKDYNAKSYRSALDKLQAYPRGVAGSDKAHYYMALCYQATNQIGAATSEYTTVYQTSKDNTLRYNSAYALQSLRKWSQHRAYSGNGNIFARTSSGPRVVSSGGG